MSKRIVASEKVYVDNETGEIKSRVTTVQVPVEPNYVKLYFDCLGVLMENGGLNACMNDMLVEVLRLARFAEEEQYVILNSHHKNKICANTGKTRRRLDYAIRTWLDNDILKRIDRDTYQINPWIFGKGKWTDISRLRATVDFTAGKVVTEKEYKQSEDSEDETQGVMPNAESPQSGEDN